MKRTLLVLILFLCLVLCGCTPALSGDHSVSPAPSDTQQTPPPSAEPSEEPSEEPSQPAEPSVEPTEPPVFGAVVPETDGTLRALPLDIGTHCNVHVWDNTVLLYNDRQSQVRSLEDGSILKKGTGVGFNQVTVTEDYIIYYVSDQKIVFRNRNLETEKIVEVNDVDISVTDMLFSPDGSRAYYHIYPDMIVELDIQTGQKREIPVDGAPIAMLSGFAMDTIYYWGKENHQDYYAFVNLSSGEYVGKDTHMSKLQTWDNSYYLCRAEDGNAEHVVVIDGVKHYIDLPKKENLHYSTYALPALSSLLTIGCFEYEHSVIVLELYDFATGECTASLTVDLGSAYDNATSVFADPSGEFIWLCMKTGTTGNYQMNLYRWDYLESTMVQ